MAMLHAVAAQASPRQVWWIHGARNGSDHPFAREARDLLAKKISFARAGLTVSWISKFQSLLELAEARDVPVRFSCRTGVCHTCECGLISGSVSYDPDPLEPPAAGNLLICCSRLREDVVIDI
jgi:ferredoxin